MIICSRFYLDTVHVDCANLIMWYLSIWWPNLKTRNTVATVRITRSFLWYVMNELMHVMQRENDVCNVRTNWCMWCNYDFWGTWIGHSSHSPWLNYGCKIECLHGLSSFSLNLLTLLCSYCWASSYYWASFEMSINI